MNEAIKASPELMKFFNRILEVKEFVKEKSEELDADPLLREVYNKLDAIIKNEGE